MSRINYFSGVSCSFGYLEHSSKQKMLFRFEKVSWPQRFKPSGKHLCTREGTRGCEQQSQSWPSTGGVLLLERYFFEENGQQQSSEGKLESKLQMYLFNIY